MMSTKSSHPDQSKGTMGSVSLLAKANEEDNRNVQVVGRHRSFAFCRSFSHKKHMRRSASTIKERTACSSKSARSQHQSSPPEILAFGAVLDHLVKGGDLKEANRVYKQEFQLINYKTGGIANSGVSHLGGPNVAHAHVCMTAQEELAKHHQMKLQEVSNDEDDLSTSSCEDDDETETLFGEDTRFMDDEDDTRFMEDTTTMADEDNEGRQGYDLASEVTTRLEPTVSESSFLDDASPVSLAVSTPTATESDQHSFQKIENATKSNVENASNALETAKSFRSRASRLNERYAASRAISFRRSSESNDNTKCSFEESGGGGENQKTSGHEGVNGIPFRDIEPIGKAKGTTSRSLNDNATEQKASNDNPLPMEERQPNSSGLSTCDGPRQRLSTPRAIEESKGMAVDTIATTTLLPHQPSSFDPHNQEEQPIIPFLHISPRVGPSMEETEDIGAIAKKIYEAESNVEEIHDDTKELSTALPEEDPTSIGMEVCENDEFMRCPLEFPKFNSNQSVSDDVDLCAFMQSIDQCSKNLKEDKNPDIVDVPTCYPTFAKLDHGTVAAVKKHLKRGKNVFPDFVRLIKVKGTTETEQLDVQVDGMNDSSTVCLAVQNAIEETLAECASPKSVWDSLVTPKSSETRNIDLPRKNEKDDKESTSTQQVESKIRVPENTLDNVQSLNDDAELTVEETSNDSGVKLVTDSLLIQKSGTDGSNSFCKSTRKLRRLLQPLSLKAIPSNRKRSDRSDFSLQLRAASKSTIASTPSRIDICAERKNASDATDITYIVPESDPVSDEKLDSMSKTEGSGFSNNKVVTKIPKEETNNGHAEQYGNVDATIIQPNAISHNKSMIPSSFLTSSIIALMINSHNNSDATENVSPETSGMRAIQVMPSSSSTNEVLQQTKQVLSCQIHKSDERNVGASNRAKEDTRKATDGQSINSPTLVLPNSCDCGSVFEESLETALNSSGKVHVLDEDHNAILSQTSQFHSTETLENIGQELLYVPTAVADAPRNRIGSFTETSERLLKSQSAFPRVETFQNIGQELLYVESQNFPKPQGLPFQISKRDDGIRSTSESHVTVPKGSHESVDTVVLGSFLGMNFLKKTKKRFELDAPRDEIQEMEPSSVGMSCHNQAQTPERTVTSGVFSSETQPMDKGIDRIVAECAKVQAQLKKCKMSELDTMFGLFNGSVSESVVERKTCANPNSDSPEYSKIETLRGLESFFSFAFPKPPITESPTDSNNGNACPSHAPKEPHCGELSYACDKDPVKSQIEAHCVSDTHIEQKQCDSEESANEAHTIEADLGRERSRSTCLSTKTTEPLVSAQKKEPKEATENDIFAPKRVSSNETTRSFWSVRGKKESTPPIKWRKNTVFLKKRNSRLTPKSPGVEI